MLRIHQFVGITVKMGKNFALDEAVVEKESDLFLKCCACHRSMSYVSD